MIYCTKITFGFFCENILLSPNLKVSVFKKCVLLLIVFFFFHRRVTPSGPNSNKNIFKILIINVTFVIRCDLPWLAHSVPNVAMALPDQTESHFLQRNWALSRKRTLTLPCWKKETPITHFPSVKAPPILDVRGGAYFIFLSLTLFSQPIGWAERILK